MTRVFARVLIGVAVSAGTAHAQYAIRIAGVQSPGMTDPGLAGVVVADFDGDGRDDVAIAGLQRAIPTNTGDDQPQAGLVAIVRYDTSRSAYRMAQWLVGDQARLAGIASDHAARPGLVAVSFDGVIEHYTGWPLVPTTRFATGHAAQSVRVGDVDGDGHVDVVLADANAGVAAYSLESGALERDYAGRATSSIELAQLDGDPALELVLAGTPGLVVDGATNALDWQDAGGFGPLLAAGRILGEPRDGFVAGWQWGYFNGYRSSPYSPIWTVKIQRMDALSVADVDADGVAEIFESGSNGFLVRDAITQAVREQYFSAPLGRMVVARMRGDSTHAYVFGEHLGWSGGDTVAVVASGSGVADYQLHEETWPFRMGTSADVSGDGVADAVWISTASDARYSGGRLHIYDPVTHEERWHGGIESAGGSFFDYPLTAVAVGRVRAVASADIVIGAGNYDSDARLYVMGGATHRVMSSNTGIGALVDHVLVMQDGGEPRVLAAMANAQFAMFDGSLNEIWRFSLGSTLAAHILDMQPAPAIGAGVVLLATGREVIAFDTATRTVAWQQSWPAVSAAVLQRADGTHVVGVLTGDGTLRLADIAGHPSDTLPLGSGEAGSVRAAGEPGKAVACIDRRVVLLDIDAASTLAQSDSIGALACSGGELLVAAPRGGATLVRASSLGGVFDLVLEAPVIFSDGFDSSAP